MRKTIRRILVLWAPHRLIGIALIVTMFLQTAFTVVLAIALKIVIDGVIDDQSSIDAGPVILMLLAAFVISASAAVAAGYMSALAGARILADVRTTAFDHLQLLTLGFYARAQVGDLLAHFSSDVAQLSQGVIKQPLAGLKALTALVFYVPVMALLEWRLTALTVVVMPIALYFSGRLAPDADSALDEEKLRIAHVLDEVHESLSAQPAIRAYGIGGRASLRFGGRIDRLLESSTRAEFRVNVLGTIAQFGIAIVQLLIVGLGAWLALNGDLAAGTLAAFVALLTEFTWETTVIGGEVIPEITKAGAGIRRIDDLLASGPVIEVSQSGGSPPLVTEAIRFENVTFGYDDSGEMQLHDLSLTLPAGGYVALVGPSGSGKSTLLSLIIRFYDPQSGVVSIDGTDLRTVARDDLRSGIGVVFQETFLFDATIGENISLANPEASPAEIEQAAAQAGLEELIEGFPEGLNELIGPRGRRLSGGQKQRVGIARALVRQPRLLLLDEMTSALDPSTEAEVNRTLEDVGSDRTIVSVTHRLRSVAAADLIVVLESGVVVETGSFEQLVEAGGLFAGMWEKQSGFTVSGDGRGAHIAPERLQLIPMFADFDQTHLAKLTHQFVSDHHVPDELVFSQGDPADRFYVIARGRVEVVRATDSGDMVLALLEDGDFFGEMALLDDSPRNASIRVVVPTVTLSLSREDFESLLVDSPRLAESVRAIAASRADLPRSP